MYCSKQLNILAFIDDLPVIFIILRIFFKIITRTQWVRIKRKEKKHSVENQKS